MKTEKKFTEILKQVKRKKKAAKRVVENLRTEGELEKFLNENIHLVSKLQKSFAESLYASYNANVDKNYLINCIKIRKGMCIYCNHNKVAVLGGVTKFKFRCKKCCRSY
jgi:predicted ribosome quality control (RQC) complex YloA/Tae2 family protein